MGRYYSILLVVISCCTNPVLPYPGAARAQQPAVAAPLPSDAELDAMLAARNWDGLGEALSPRPGDKESFGRAMNWLQTRIDSGGGFLLGLIYARDLWEVGESLKVADWTEDMRIAAGMITLYTLELIVIDGIKCEGRGPRTP